MAGPGGREVGRVSVRALPDTSSFARSLERYLDRVERRLRVEIPVELASGDVAATEATLAELTRDRKVEVEVDVDRSVVDRLGSVLGGISGAGGGLMGGAGGLGKLTKVAGILAAIVVAGNIAGVLIAALPGILAAVVGPIGAIALGFEGIKDAAEQLAVPFANLRETVAGVFREGLMPVFRELGEIFPTLEVGFSAIADSLVQIADVVTGALTGERGLSLIGSTFDHIADAMEILAPAMGPLTDTLLTLANEGAAAFERWAPKIADVIEGFNGIIRKLEKDGTLAKAFDVLGFMITGAIALFGALVVWSTWSMGVIADIAQAVGGVIKGIGRVVGTVTGGISKAFGTMGRLITAATRGDWGTVRQIVGSVADAVLGIAGRMKDRVVAAVAGMAARVVVKAGELARGMVNRLSSLPGDLRSLAGRALARFLDGVQSGADRVLGFVSRLPGRIRDAVGGLGSLLYGAGASVIDGFIDGIRSKIGEIASTLGSITNRLPDWKGPESTDRAILYPSGQFVVDGFVDGIESRVGTIRDSLRGLTGSLPDMTLAGAGPLGGAAAGASLADILAQLQRLEVRVGSVVGDLPRQQRDIRRQGKGRS